MIALVIFLGFLPSFAWLFFYLKEEDYHPEPKQLILLTFVMGMLFALLALSVELGVACFHLSLRGNSCDDLHTATLTASLPFILLFAFVEEIAKFGAAFFSVHKNPAFDEPVDAMIYTTVAALGFAAVENLGVLHQPDNSVFLGNVFAITSLRFVGATLLHTLASAFLGYYWAMSIREFGAARFIVIGLLMATGLHAIFNYLIITNSSLAYSLIFLIIAGFFLLNDFEKLKARAV